MWSSSVWTSQLDKEMPLSTMGSTHAYDINLLLREDLHGHTSLRLSSEAQRAALRVLLKREMRS